MQQAVCLGHQPVKQLALPDPQPVRVTPRVLTTACHHGQQSPAANCPPRQRSLHACLLPGTSLFWRSSGLGGGARHREVTQCLAMLLALLHSACLPCDPMWLVLQRHERVAAWSVNGSVMCAMMQLRQQGALDSAQQQPPQKGQQGNRSGAAPSAPTRAAEAVARAAAALPQQQQHQQQSVASEASTVKLQVCSARLLARSRPGQSLTMATPYTCTLAVAKSTCNVQSFDLRSSGLRGVEAARFGCCAAGQLSG